MYSFDLTCTACGPFHLTGMAQVLPAEEVKVAAVAAEAKPAAEVTATIASTVDATLQGMQPMDGCPIICSL